MPNSNDNSFAIMKAIGELKSDIQKDIGVVKSQNATQLEKITSLRNELLGDGGRVKNIEDRFKDQDFWHNVKTFVVIPVVFGLHKIATLMGWKI
jgi:hypothetical protein